MEFDGSLWDRVVEILALAVAAVVVLYVRPWVMAQVARIQRRVSEDELAQVRYVVRTLVEAAEQMKDLADGESKLVWVMGQAEVWLEGLGLELAPGVLGAQVEAVVRAVKAESRKGEV